MTLSTQQVADLTAAFPSNEHEFFNGLAYVDEMAVCSRLDKVDPEWEFVRAAEPIYGENRVTVFYRMTIGGVPREDCGTSRLTNKKKDGTIYPIDEPEKNAVTDALRRCARRFGVGRYLLLCPSDVKDMQSMARWLGETPQNALKTTPASAKSSDLQPTGTNTPTTLESPKKGDVRDFTFKGFTTKQDSNGKPYYSFETTGGQFGFYAFSRDPFRAVGIADTLSEGYKKVGSKIKFEHTMPCVYTLPDGRQDGYWLLNPPKIETSSEITF